MRYTVSGDVGSLEICNNIIVGYCKWLDLGVGHDNESHCKHR